MTEFAAIDFGASSGRVVCGRFDGAVMTLEACHRFANRPVRLPDGLRWNLMHLFTEAVGALRGRKLDGIGVDTWGVDYALLDEHGRVLGLPFHYRDTRTEGASGVAGYDVTGIQDMPINTVYQLLAEKDSAALREAHSIALVPDLLAYWLSGELANEVTNASTTALLDARTGTWAHGLIEELGLPTRPFKALVEPGTRLGPTLAHHEIDAPVFTVASHDTASAYAATPLRGEHSAILSSGTWSLLGLELPGPVFSDPALTNERGVDGSIRLLKNVMGLWLEQECARVWDADFPSLQAAAREAEGVVFDVDDERFLHGGDMPALIGEMIGRHRSRGEIVRSIYVSLAHKYKLVLERLEAASGRDVRTINVIGGGARNALLCQLTADVTGREVIAGPVEATALGNVLVQARAAGELASLSDMRAVSAASFEPVRYEPSKELHHA